MFPAVRVLLVLLIPFAGFQAYSGPPAPPPGPFSDVAGNHWAVKSIQLTALDKNWLLPTPGPVNDKDATAKPSFRPTEPITRLETAVAVVRALAPSAKPNPKMTFKDLASDKPGFVEANVAASLRLLGTTKAGEFLPSKPITKADLALVLTQVLGVKAELAGLDKIATVDGAPLKHPRSFAALTLSGALRLYYNHLDNALDLLPDSNVTRADAAHALTQAFRAAGTWRISALKRFRTITLPTMSEPRRAAVEFALAQVGYPYIPAGEWFRKTPDGYCCGAQPQGGFDCSGFVWWVVRAPGNGYDNTKFRPYKGWALPQRSSREMAKAATPRLTVDQALPTDLLFSDVDGKGKDWEAIDHVGLALGGGWMIHASVPGVLIEWIADGWWTSRIRWARRIGLEPTGAPPQPKTS